MIDYLIPQTKRESSPLYGVHLFRKTAVCHLPANLLAPAMVVIGEVGMLEAFSGEDKESECHLCVNPRRL